MSANGGQPSIVPGMYVTPGPMAAMVSAQSDQQGNKIILLHIEHATGMSVYPMDSGMARNLGDALVKESTGLQVVREPFVPPTSLQR